MKRVRRNDAPWERRRIVWGVGNVGCDNIVGVRNDGMDNVA